MNDELIYKNDVLALLQKLQIVYEEDGDCYNELFESIAEDIPTVTAVETPCQIGDNIYQVFKDGKRYRVSNHTLKAAGFEISGDIGNYVVTEEEGLRLNFTGFGSIYFAEQSEAFNFARYKNTEGRWVND